MVCVNSSMLARVPGPADLEATDATISAYATGTTDDTACTIGTVAWAPQLIMLMFMASTCSRKFTGGETSGPTAAGVRSTATMPASSSRGAAARCALADVASKTICGSSVAGEQPVHTLGRCLDPHRPGPLEPVRLDHAHDVLRPRSTSLRWSFASRSVPMLPGPMMAARALVLTRPTWGSRRPGGTFTSVTRLR